MSDSRLQIDALQQRFAIPGKVQVVAANGGLARVSVSTQLASADIYLHGAQVTSWKPAGKSETLFLSQLSHWKDGKAIRGGVPICFPWFRAKRDDPQAPAHGFVRTRAWTLDSVNEEDGGSLSVVLSTTSDESTRRWWPHDFHAQYRVTVGPTLSLELTITNTGSTLLSFEEALHTYFLVGDARQVRVRGLDQERYLDNTDGNREKIQIGDETFSKPTDNAYLNARWPLELIDPVKQRTLLTAKENSATTVVWNPWQQGAASLADLGDDEWQSMACVEASNILDAAVTLEPGATHSMRATLQCL